MSSLLLRGAGGKTDAASGVTVKTVERIDTMASLEVKGGSRGVVSEKHAKHGGRKLLPVVKKREARGSGEGEGMGEMEDQGWSGVGVDFGWEARSTRDGKSLAGGVLGRMVEDPSSRSSPALSRGRDSEEEEDGGERGSDNSDSSCGTVVSLSTSLPIIFSGLNQQQQQQQQLQRPSPLLCGSTTAGGAASVSVVDDGAGSAGATGADGGKDGATEARAAVPVVAAVAAGERIATGVKKTAPLTALVKGTCPCTCI